MSIRRVEAATAGPPDEPGWAVRLGFVLNNALQ
jgi:hypothetical protein